MFWWLAARANLESHQLPGSYTASFAPFEWVRLIRTVRVKLVEIWIYIYIYIYIYFDLAPQPPAGQGLLIHKVSRSHQTTHHSRQDSPGHVFSSSQRPLSDKTQLSQQTDIHAARGIRIHNLSRRAAADPRLIQQSDAGETPKRIHNTF